MNKSYLKCCNRYSGCAIWEVKEDGLVLITSENGQGYWWVEFISYEDIEDWTYEDAETGDQTWDIITHDEAFLDIL